jgi:hypothetical protein
LLIGAILNTFRWFLPGVLQAIVIHTPLIEDFEFCLQSDIYYFAGKVYYEEPSEDDASYSENETYLTRTAKEAAENGAKLIAYAEEAFIITYEEEKVLTDKEVQQCEALNRIKDAIDLLISNRRELIFNEPDFNAQVIGAVARCLHEIELKAKPDDRRYVAGVLAGEYLREFNVIK